MQDSLQQVEQSVATVMEKCVCPPLSLCPVCATFLGRFYDSLKDNRVTFNNMDIEKALMQSCKDAKGKENRFVSHLRDKLHTHCCSTFSYERNLELQERSPVSASADQS